MLGLLKIIAKVLTPILKPIIRVLQPVMKAMQTAVQQVVQQPAPQPTKEQTPPQSASLQPTPRSYSPEEQAAIARQQQIARKAEYFDRDFGQNPVNLSWLVEQIADPLLRTFTHKVISQPDIVLGVLDTSKSLDTGLNTILGLWRDGEQNSQSYQKALDRLLHISQAQEEPIGGSEETEEILRQIWNALPGNYRPDTMLYWTRETNHRFIQETVQARDMYLRDLFVGTSESINLPLLTNMSDLAMAAFMFSQARGENWNLSTNMPRPDPGNVLGGLGSIVYTNPLAYGIETLIERRANPHKTQRTAATSLGVANIYMGQLFEAVIFQSGLQTTLGAYVEPANSRLTFDYFDRLTWSYAQIEDDPFEGIRSLNYIMNWAGARQQVNIGAGSRDFPAVTPETFSGEKRSVEEVSAFSLAITRYTDSVDAEVFSSTAIFNRELTDSPELMKVVNSVEGTDDAARMLGYSFGDTGSDIVIGTDFIPYTNDQTLALVDALTERANRDPEAVRTLCSATMLRAQYRNITGVDALDTIACPEN